MVLRLRCCRDLGYVWSLNRFLFSGRALGLCKLEAGWTIRRPGAGTVLSGPGPFLRQRAVCIRGPGLGVRETLGSDLYSFSLNTKWELLIYLYVFYYLKVTAVY